MKTIKDYMRLLRGLIENGELNECRDCEKGIGVALLEVEEIEALGMQDRMVKWEQRPGVEFMINVIQDEDTGEATVTIETDLDLDNLSQNSGDFLNTMCACEYFMHIIAKESRQPTKRALELLVEGAMTYVDGEILDDAEEEE